MCKCVYIQTQKQSVFKKIYLKPYLTYIQFPISTLYHGFGKMAEY